MGARPASWYASATRSVVIALISAPTAERHHQPEPPRLGELREAGHEQRTDEQRRLPERRPQPCFEHARFLSASSRARSLA